MSETFSIDATEVYVEPSSGRKVSLRFDANKSDVIELFDMQDFIDQFGVSDILDAIGIDAAIDNFGVDQVLDHHSIKN